MTEPVTELVDHLFRRQAGQMVSTLTSILGPHNLQLAEDVVQEALLRALQLWPFQGTPQNPKAWLIQVAKNLALDRLRRESSLQRKIPELERRMPSAGPQPLDEQLAMMFLCCHPRLPEQSRVCLTLKVVAGFSVSEIARAFLAKEEAIAQRIVRAKRQIRDENLPLELPEERQRSERLDSVLEALYLIFNEGYTASGGETLLRRDLCEEVLYLTGLIAANPATALPKVHALLALEFLQAARLDARTDASGDLLLLEEQDRSLWSSGLIARGFQHLDRSAAGSELTAYHLQAAIAAAHSSAPSLDATDWDHIVHLYDHLAERSPSPVILLNRAVAVARRDGPQAGLAALNGVEAHPSLHGYYLLHAVLADLHYRAGDPAKARAGYRAALRCPCNAAERRFLEKRLAALGP